MNPVPCICSQQIPLLEPKRGEVTVITSAKKTVLAIAFPRGRHHKSVVSIAMTHEARGALAAALAKKGGEA